MDYREEVITYLKNNGLKTNPNIEKINSLRSKHEKSWEWVRLALDESTIEDWRKYGLALMLKPDFQTRVDEKLNEKNRRRSVNSDLTPEEIQAILNPPMREIVCKDSWSPWSAVYEKDQTRFVQTKKGIFGTELNSHLCFFPDYDYTRYFEDYKLGNIYYLGEPAPGALGWKRRRHGRVNGRFKLFDIS